MMVNQKIGCCSANNHQIRKLFLQFFGDCKIIIIIDPKNAEVLLFKLKMSFIREKMQLKNFFDRDFINPLMTLILKW